MSGFYILTWLDPRTYRASKRNLRDMIHIWRDPGSHVRWTSAFERRGRHFRGFLVHPAKEVLDDYPDQSHDSVPRVQMNDLFLITTRPPLVVGEQAKRPVLASGHKLERRLLQPLESVFSTCERHRITLQAFLGEALDEHEAGEYADVTFLQNNCGYARYLHGGPGPRVEIPAIDRRALGYAVFLPSSGPKSSDVLACFSAGGTESYWANCLALEGPPGIRITPEELKVRSPWLRLFEFTVPGKVPLPFLDHEAVDLTARPIAKLEFAKSLYAK